MSKPTDRAFLIAGAPVAYRLQGTGSPVLLVHGVPGDLRTLAPVAQRLSSGFEAITVSLPALSGPVRPMRPFGTAGQRDDLIDIIRTLGRGPVHLVAWSYSAHAAMAAAIERRDLIRSLFLYEPGFPTFVEDPAARDVVMSDTMAAFGPVAEAFGRGDRATALRLAIDGAAGVPGHFDAQPEEIRAIHRDTASAVEAIFTQTPPLPLGPADLDTIGCPTTVSRGAKTRDCYRIVSDTAARLIPGANHVVVANAGHLLPEKEPDRFAALVRTHLLQAENETSKAARLNQSD